MEKEFPFTVEFVGNAEQFYRLSADFEEPELLRYKSLFDEYSSLESLISLVDVAALVIEEAAPALLDCMDFDEEGYLLDMHVDSEENLQLFKAKICPVFQNVTVLAGYVKRVAAN